MSRNFIAVTAICIIAALLAVWMLVSPNESNDAHEHEYAHDDHQRPVTKGPHGGRLLIEDDFGIEVTIFETGLPPEFRVYAYHVDQPLQPEQVKLDIELKRTADKLEHIKFTPQDDYLRGDAVVYEPHSFEVSINASYEGNTYSWQYDNFEGRTQIPANIARKMGIQTEAAGPVILTETRTLTGRVQTNPNRLSRVLPRFPGVVKSIRHELGDAVKAGDILATVQSNESLQDYHLKAPIDGLIIKRDIQLGEATGDLPLFVIADLSAVWVELDVFVRDLDLISKGMPVTVETLEGVDQKTAIIDWVSPLTAHASQSVRARLTVLNEDGRLRPGQFVRGHVTIAEHEIPLAVRQSALQRFRDFQVVFACFDDVYEVRMLELGRQNRDWVEVLGGIEPGTQYVTDNSYLIKADIEKSGASHDH
jgi:cobalt-zinc-cadmium efflux system membrane fusion protein